MFTSSSMEPPEPAKSIPVHCVVESINHVYQWSQKYSSPGVGSKGHVELDRFVIIPNNTAFRDLTEAALVRLGYSKDIVAASKGLVVLKNWLPLDLDTIAEDPVLTVSDVLGELTTLATLRILVFRESKNRFSDLKDKLLKLLLVQSQTQLAASGCPLDEAIILQMMKVGQACPDLPEDLYKKFEQWWIMQSSAVVPKIQPSVLPQSVRDMFYRNGSSPRHSNLQDNSSHCIISKTDVKPHILQSNPQSQFQGQKTRMRTSFDTELELPKLQAWFSENPHPSRQQIHHYVSELNNLESRKGRKPLDVNNVVYWFKNARAAQKRAEVRGTNSGTNDANPGINDGNMNGYCKSRSPSEHGGKSYSGQGSASDVEDEEDEEFEENRDDDDVKPMSPPEEQPMSLTTHGRFSNGDADSSRPQSRSSQISSDHKVMVIKEEPPDKEKSTGLNNNNYDDDDDFDEDMEDEGSDGGSCKQITSSPDQSSGGHPVAPNVFHSAASDLHQPLVRPGFPIVPNSMFSHSFMYMSQCLPGFNMGRRPQPDTPPPQSQQQQVRCAPNVAGLNLSALAEERRKRNRTFIDPVSEVPRLEQWFEHNTHPSHSLIAKYTDELNRMPYRQKFPRLESKNVQFWFKNRRAKCKRLKMSLYDAMSPKDQFTMPTYLNHD
ncbi:uncharacterized protein LOC126835665 isoform X2 [Adelges cooleyi]|uniref:uncharacterized protein LOC126835665 isoform X2 n=1 Tax=Adelges cooleyi TaxID=133065 RepID=UPI00217FFA0B|nr:uncharacterized protein LOC126835665 isoform X2 [Adelges cooleyi]